MIDKRTEVLAGSGWQTAVSQNPHTHRWHWIVWQGRADFGDKDFIAAYNRSLEQSEETRDEAIEAAVRYALDQNADCVNQSMFDVPVEDQR